MSCVLKNQQQSCLPRAPLYYLPVHRLLLTFSISLLAPDSLFADFALFDLDFHHESIALNEEIPTLPSGTPGWPKALPSEIIRGELTVVPSLEEPGRALQFIAKDQFAAMIELNTSSPFTIFDSFRVQFSFTFLESFEPLLSDRFEIRFPGSAMGSLIFSQDGQASLRYDAWVNDSEAPQPQEFTIPLATFDPESPIECTFEFNQPAGTASTTINGITIHHIDLFNGAGTHWGTSMFNHGRQALCIQHWLSFIGRKENGIILNQYKLTGLGSAFPFIVDPNSEITDPTPFVEIPISIPTEGEWIFQHSADLAQWKTISGPCTNPENKPAAVIMGTETSKKGWIRLIPVAPIAE